jgi:predicted NBD/HSP70 family sugar kinase
VPGYDVDQIISVRPEMPMNHPADKSPVLRQISMRVAMDVLLQDGPTSRAGLAKKTGLSKQTMSEVIRILEEGGWVRAKGIVNAKLGRSAMAYEVADDGGYAFGIEMGVSIIRMAIVSIAGNIVHESQYPTGGRTGEALIIYIQDLVHLLLQEAGITLTKVLLGAVATPGVVEPQTGRLMFATHMGETGSLDIVSRLSQALGCRVVIENDVNAAALGEAWQGCSAGLDASAFVSLGAGVGLGLLINGKLVKGARGAAGEIAYLPLGGDPYADKSLECGTLETAIGADAVLRRFTDAGGRSAGLEDMLSQAEDGQEPALSVLRATARLTSLLVLSVDAMFDPDMIVLGGPVGCHPLMSGLVCAELPRLTRRNLVLQTTTLGSRAVLVGAVAIALNQLHNALFSPQALPGEMRLPPSLR